jgi:sulfate permease, SulP family
VTRARDGVRAALVGARRFVPRPADYDRRTWRADLVAGATVAVVALPLALGFGVTSGAGAAAGVITAIVAGTLAAVFGGSNLQVSGPTGAMTVVLLPLVARYGVTVLAPVALLAGAMLLVLAAARIGRIVRFIPAPVVTGFSAGIAVIILLQQVPLILGVTRPPGEHILPVTRDALLVALRGPLAGLSSVGSAGDALRVLGDPTLALVTVAVIVLWGRSRRLTVMPASMAGLVAGTAVSLLPAFAEVVRVGALPTRLPPITMPSFAGFEVTDLVRAALVIALLAALESLLSAVVADGMTVGERHDPDRELFGQGVANLGVALVGGIPATAALARTAVNVRSGARTRLAAASHGLIIAALVVLLAPLAGRIPLAVLGGILIVVALRMVESSAVRDIARSTRSDAATMLLTFGVTVTFDLILAIEVGLLAAAGLFMLRMSTMFSIDASVLGGAPTEADLPESERERDPRIVVFRIEGPVFFGAANRFFEELLQVDNRMRVVVLRLRGVPMVDATGAAALRDLVTRLAGRGMTVLLSGVHEQPHGVLERSGVLAELVGHGGGVHASTDDAIARARHLVAADL